MRQQSREKRRKTGPVSEMTMISLLSTVSACFTVAVCAANNISRRRVRVPLAGPRNPASTMPAATGQSRGHASRSVLSRLT